MFEDSVAILTPVMVIDPYTEEQSADWTQPPTSVLPEAAEVQPMSSTEAVVTAGTLISRWQCFLESDTTATATKRVRWDGTDYEVEGKVEPWKVGGAVDHFEAVLKLVEG